VTAPSRARERRILRGFGRAALNSDWWKTARVEPRYCLKCGGALRERFLREEGRPRRVCRACGFIAYENPKLVAATLPVRRGRLCLLRRDIEPSRGFWTFPAGYMEMNESVEEAAVRETREEIRCRVVLEGLHGVYSYADSGVVTVVYRARVVGPGPRAGKESQCVKAFLPKDIPWDELAFRSTYHALKDYVGNGGGRRLNG
jgi:ADP-ribose pyrophosphatase YjhB (NUDIX family)